MTDPIKNTVQNPESFTTTKPEIVSMMDEAQTNTVQQANEVGPLEYRIEVKDSFQIMGLSGYEQEDTDRSSDLTGLWVDFTAKYDKKLQDYYTLPYGQVGACNEKYVDGKMKIIIGAEYKGQMIEGMSLETIPAATYAVFTFPYPAGYSYYMAAAAKIREWFPTSGYRLDEDAYRLEVYLDHWEIWMPVLTQSPESFNPTKPEIIGMMDEACNSVFEQTVTDSGIINFEIAPFGPYRFIGKSVYFGNKKGLAEFGIFDYMWKHRDWVWGKLDNVTEYNSDESHNAALVTWDRYDDKNQLLGYSVGRFMQADTPVPDGLDYIDIPETHLAKGWWRKECDEGKWFAYGDAWVNDEINRTGEYMAAGWKFMAEVHPVSKDGLPLIGAYIPCIPLSEEEKAEHAREKKAAVDSENARETLIEMMNNTVPRNELECSDELTRITNDMATPREFTAPLKIEMRAKLDGEHTPHNHLVVKYADGNILINWINDICNLHIQNMAGDKQYECGNIAADEFMDIEWIIGREFMSVKLDGVLRHIGNNHRYIREFRDNPGYSLSSAVTVVNTNATSTAVVESLRVTEI